MDPSSQGDSNGNKGKNAYSSWTNEEREVLLSLLVDTTKRGWKDKNGSFSKRTIETSILPVLNQKYNCNKTHENYKGAMKWFRNRFDVSHKTHNWIITTAFDDYNDICIIFGGKAATGRITVDVSQNVTTATTCENEDKMIQDYVDSGPKKNARNESDSITPAIDSKDELIGSVSAGVTYISSHIEALRAIIEEKSVGRRIEKLEKIKEQKKKQCESDSVYAAIMEIPDLTTDERFQVVEMLSNKSKKEMFMYLSANDRNDWIRSKLNK
ncbi:hypothetical protein MKX03_023049 [Papaver bracteatum]|nr:hypothetical protein MKX03_023049 [Papaver bracteatum]